MILVHKPLCRKIRHMCAFKPKACNSDYLRYWGTCQIYFTKLNGSVVVLRLMNQRFKLTRSKVQL